MLPYNLQIYFEKSNCRRQIHCLKQIFVRTTKKQHCIYCGVIFWNSLDDNKKMCNTEYLFKNILKMYYYLPVKKNEYMFYFSSQLLLSE